MMFSPLFGYAFPEYGWVPAPTYVMRRAMIMARLRGCRPGRVLEIGPGAGALLRELADGGYCGVAVEQSREARELVGKVLQGAGDFRVVGNLPAADEGGFDYLFAFEVLEHMEDDRSALEQWSGLLNPGGLVMLSVPAHRDRWDDSDVWAGHCRRYEKEELQEKLRGAGLTVVSLESYGWPLANLLKPIRALRCRLKLQQERQGGGRDRLASSHRSGIERTTESRAFRLYTGPVFRPLFRLCMAAQELVRQYEWGTGFIVVARRDV